MSNNLDILPKKYSLKYLNTFALDVYAQKVIIIFSVRKLIQYWKQYQRYSIPILILGTGSNVLFLENFQGLIFLNKIKGITVHEQLNYWSLHIGAGEIWHDIVKYCILKNIFGIENLAFIPGCIGAAVINNIGAYGLEFSQLCEYVDILSLKTKKTYRLTNTECLFGYRDSIFRYNTLFMNDVIIAVGIKISKFWQPILGYKSLSHLNINNITAKQIYNTIYRLRHRSLPNPLLFGNVGSFFKNPVITMQKAKQLLNIYKDLPVFLVNGNIRIAAGWLIEHCGLKGFKLHRAGIYNKHAVVLVNLGNATAKNILALANYVASCVIRKFTLKLEPEVHFISATGKMK